MEVPMDSFYRIVFWTLLLCHHTWSKEECNQKLGMQSKIIPNESITSSSQLKNHAPSDARLHGRKAWCSALEDKSPYIQILLDEEKSITAIETQGSSLDFSWSRKYDVWYLKEGKWTLYKEGLIGNRNTRSTHKNYMNPPIITTSIRIYPKDPFALIITAPKVPCLRLELHGCSAPADCRDPGMPSNGRRIGNNFNHGKQITFECLQGFVLVGNSTSVCHKGKWSHVVPNCKVPTLSTPTPTPFQTPAPCKATVDVAFIVDSSGSIGRRRWPLMLNFVKYVISVFNVGPDGTHVAVVAYSTNAVLEFTFNELSGAQISAEQYGKLINKIRLQRGYTYIDKALKLADEQVFTASAGMRSAVPKVAIVITDGEQTETGGFTPLDEASQGLKDKGVVVYSLGVGSRVNPEQLRQIASSDENVFTSARFEELVDVVKPIVEQSCPIKPTPSPTPVDGGWSGWNGWTFCSKSCGTGSQQRSRSCTSPPPSDGGKSCHGAARETQVCNSQPCPVPGGWSSWSLLTPCSVSCGSGIDVFTRTCTNPKPQHGGKSCQGIVREERACSKKHCPVDGGWSAWSSWSTCGKTCGGGLRERARSCTNPPPFSGGKSCQGLEREHQICNQNPCPVDGLWSEWSGWSSCSRSCGTGSRERSRSCTRPAPSFGGKQCSGEARKSHECNTHSCPVDGGWSVWNSWSPCGKTCGGGVRERTRSCTNPPPFYGGKGCGTHYYESRECYVKICPIDGGWTSWSGWSSCSKSCGTGSLERSRSCTQPAPNSGGKPCPGTARESSWCNSHACPVDGGWSTWSNWTECSVTCGTGVMSRERRCDNPEPVAGGRSCLGHPRDVKPCNTSKICTDGVGCFGNFPSTLLKDFRDDIDWFGTSLPFSKRMEKIVEKCAHVAKAKGLRFFAVENYGNCYGTRDYSPGTQPKTTRCNFGVGLENHYYVYEVSQ